jgi:hypothetical protein
VVVDTGQHQPGQAELTKGLLGHGGRCLRDFARRVAGRRGDAGIGQRNWQCRDQIYVATIGLLGHSAGCLAGRF